MSDNRSISFFDEQFRRQSGDAALKLNPFEELALPYLKGEVLDFGCGLGNLSLAAAARGCIVTALDGSPAAIEHLKSRAASTSASVEASLADLRKHPLTRDYDCIVSIGLLMFFDCTVALQVLSDLQGHVRPGGVAIVNVLVEGTTYMDMFDPSGHCLFAPSELQGRFRDWEVERVEYGDYDAPRGTIKRFCTVVARKPRATGRAG